MQVFAANLQNQQVGRINRKESVKSRFLFTAPPAKLCLAGGFRTVSFFHGFGHGDVWFVKDLLDFFRSFLLGCWISQFFRSFSKKKKKKLIDTGF